MRAPHTHTWLSYHAYACLSFSPLFPQWTIALLCVLEHTHRNNDLRVKIGTTAAGATCTADAASKHTCSTSSHLAAEFEVHIGSSEISNVSSFQRCIVGDGTAVDIYR